MEGDGLGVVKRGTDEGDGKAEGSTEDDGREDGEGFPVEDEFAVLGQKGEVAIGRAFTLFESSGGDAFEKFVFFGDKGSETGDIGAKFWVDGFEFREDASADPDASEVEVVVPGIVEDGEFVLLYVVEDLGSGEAEERSDNVLAAFGDSGESGHAGPAREVKEDGFDEVILGVGGGDQGAIGLVGGLVEKRVAGFSSGFFETDVEVLGQKGDIGRAGEEGCAEALGKGLAVLDVLSGFGALLMVEVGGDDVDPRLDEEMEEAGGIGAAGEAEEDSGATRLDSEFGETLPKEFEHLARLPIPGKGLRLKSGSVESGSWRPNEGYSPDQRHI